MSSNPETLWGVSDSSEKQQIMESAKVGVDSLKEEISVTAWTKSELSTWFSKFFERLKNMWNEFKQWHLGNAISVLFGNKDEEKKSEWTTEQKIHQDVSNTAFSMSFHMSLINQWSKVFLQPFLVIL